MKQKIVLIVSVVVGLLAFLMTNNYISNIRKELYKGALKVPIIVAKKDIPKGAVLDNKDLAIKEEFKSAIGENIFRPEGVNDVIGKRLLFPLKKGEPLWWSHVSLPRRERDGLAPMIKSGLRAVSISISGAAGVSGLIKPANRVDILGTFTFPSATHPGEVESATLTILQDVTVLATGQNLSRNELGGEYNRRSTSYSTVTFELTPREAELLVFAQHVKGQLSLSLRNPEDGSYESELPSVNFEHIESKLTEYNQYRQLYIRDKKEL